MRHFNWKKTYETGIVEIDKQHKKLFELSNTFYEELFSENFRPGTKEIISILNELKDYSEFHCNYEKEIYSEDIIRRYFNFENLLADKIHELTEKDKSNDIIALYGFAEFLRKWLLKHILLLNTNNFREVLKKEVFNLSCN